jgi:hypothetical protein
LNSELILMVSGVAGMSWGIGLFGGGPGEV